ncbi:unnamed protein product [Callosobruchus maculatus]|nr:unnamed protein product [Callosobruchus maculatus]
MNHAKTRSERIANQKLGLSLEEAQQILNVKTLDKEEIERRFQTLFKSNENTSLYIQSKIVRAKERLDHELTNLDEKSGQKPSENEAGSKT